MATTQQVHQLENQLPQIGAMVGGPIGGAVGTALDVIGQFFGPSAHSTPSGLSYDQAEGLLYSQELTVNQLYTQVYGHALDGAIPPYAGSPTYWNYQSGLIARYLRDPSLQSSDPKKFDQLKANGSVDQAIAVQKSLIAELQNAAGQGGGAAAASAPAGGGNSTAVILVIILVVVLLSHR